jgi:tetratricopeptide (TPR) repeat protein
MNVDSSREHPTGRTWKAAGIRALLAVLVFLVFGQTASQEFVNYDDNNYVYQNTVVISGLNPGGVVHAFTQKVEGLWTPLATLSHMLDWRLYGSWAGGHHLTNVILHLGSVILLFSILLQMTGALWRSAFVAALFAIHPLNVESVAWISERKDVLSGFFFMLTLGAYLRYVQRPASAGRYLVMIFLFAMASMSKPMVVTLPFVLLLLDYWPLRRLFNQSPIESRTCPGEARRSRINRRAVVEKLPMVALSIALCLAAVLGPKQAWLVEGERIPFRIRLCQAPVWLATYLVRMIWPARLSIIYTHYETSLRWAPASLLWMGAFSVVFFLYRKKHPYLWMGWLWNLGMLMPALGFLQISRHARADHYNYLPQIGLYIGFTWLAADWAGERRPRRMALGAVAVTSLSLLSIAAWRQAGFWRDNITLWNHALGCTRDNYIAETNLGLALLDLGRTGEAVDYCREALAINPDQLDAHLNLGTALLDQGRIDEAISNFRAALQISPGNADAHNALGNALAKQGWPQEALSEYREAVRLDPANADAQYNLGVALSRGGRTQEAIPHFLAALEINPTYAAAHDSLGNAFLQLGRIEEAIAHYRAALGINPSYANAQNNLAAALLRKGQTAEAIEHLQKALDLRPGNVAILNSLALVLATAPQADLRDGPKALRLALEATRLTGGNDPNILRTLATAYAEEGKYPDAVRTARSALRIAETGGLADMLRQDLESYETGRPTRDGP